MEDASPPKWHLAHTCWFFETFVLRHADKKRQPHHKDYGFLFNSYYNGIGEHHPRPQRGHLSRPIVSDIYFYRKCIYEDSLNLLNKTEDNDLLSRVILGINHEQQHQELLLTDLKYNLGKNPMRPTYRDVGQSQSSRPICFEFHTIEGGMVKVGADLETDSFCFDNELPTHNVWLESYAIANRLVTNEEYLGFIQDGGYEKPELWLSDGWNERQKRSWVAPEYWYQDEDGYWCEYSLHGSDRVNPYLPVCHVSFYEADAFARWKGARLPTENEWEHAASSMNAESQGHFADNNHFHPVAESKVPFMCGNLWQWTASSYSPYPGYQPLDGTLGEYNGKFMSNQYVLRGGSCATPHSHYRNSYRNFFYPKDRWQFTGIRLASEP